MTINRDELVQLMESAGVSTTRGNGKKLLEALGSGASPGKSAGHGAPSDDTPRISF